ncbi:VOC family protein [Knoellia locipacati]|uniref:VOC family protein n=1 Tax=Knoellia locipacati TaxID=882824 RepID=UPI00384B518A
MRDNPDLGITVDCAEAQVLARFWCHALGYVEAPPPKGWADWSSFLTDQGVPEEEWGDGATIRPPTGEGPSISFLRVPEAKTVKNRIHLDLKVSGGRHVDQAVRRTRIRAVEADLVAHGARSVRDDTDEDGRLDHVVMQDPEGNEFCVV